MLQKQEFSNLCMHNIFAYIAQPPVGWWGEVGGGGGGEKRVERLSQVQALFWLQNIAECSCWQTAP